MNDTSAAASPLRLIHTFDVDAPSGDELAAAARTWRETAGNLEAEAFTAMDGEPGSAILELWSGEGAFDEHWRSMAAAESRTTLLDAFDLAGSGSEIYRAAWFEQRGSWVPRDSVGEPTVWWPARGAVRVIAQASVPDPERPVPFLLADQARTRREPGCMEYRWYRGAEVPTHLLLLEKWQDQAHYDAHWQLRLLTTPADQGPPPSAPRQYGSNGIEFYRYEPFQHLYGHWLPRDVAARSATVQWAG